MVAQIDSAYIRYGSYIVIRRLASYLLFEGRPHATQGQWFNPFVTLFLRSLLFAPGGSGVLQPIFISGVGRSGTTILGKLLSLHKDVGFLNEPKLMWRIIDARTDICGDYVDSGGKFRLQSEDVREEIKFKAKRLFAKYLAITGTTRALDKYPESIFRIDYLLDIFPDAKFVFITRNGTDTCLSIENWSSDHKLKGNGHEEDWWGRNGIKWKYLCEQFINVDPKYSSLKSIIYDLDEVNKAALEWVITIHEGLRAKERHPSSIIHITYEDLLEDAKGQLEMLLQRCDLVQSDAVINYGKKHLLSKSSRLPLRLNAQVQQLFDETEHTLSCSLNNTA